MKILAVSDTESKFIWEHFDPAHFRGVELILSCGDLKASYLSYLVTMIPAPLFYVHGNHDNAYDRNPPTGCESIDGRVVEYKGLRIAGLGGCLGSDPGNKLQFTEGKMEKRVKRLQSDLKRNKKLDIFVSHAPIAGVGDQADSFHAGFQCFSEIHRVCRPKLHLFGHLHLSGSPNNKQAAFRSGDVTLYNCSGYRIIDTEEAALTTV